jgi:hypothetical protein
MPDGLIWICEKWAYTRLPSTRTGSCAIGTTIGFSLLPKYQRQELGVPLFEILGTRTKRSLSIGGNQRWGEYQWPPQKIIETYGPAT